MTTNGPSVRNPVPRAAAGYAFAAAVSVALVAQLFGLSRVNLGVPFDYSGDGLQIVFFCRTAVENGWYYDNDRVGAPFALDARDWPQAETLHFALMKALAPLVGDSLAVVNVYYLLTFPLCVLSALFVFRRFDCSYGPSLVGALLFAFLPYHFYRGVTHLYLSSYYCLPLILMVVIRLYQGRVSAYEADGERTRFRPWNRTMAAGLLTCMLLGLGDVYYTFFAAYLLGVAGLARLVQTGRRQAVVTTGLLIGTLFVASLANAAPTILHGLRHGKNADAAKRMTQEADFYGLRITQMLLPIGQHRIEKLGKARTSLMGKMELVNENDWAALGAVGSVGFLFLMVRMLKRRGESDGDTLPEALSVLTVGGVLLATMGGFGLLIATFLPQIRAYNRMSVLLAFFAIFAVVLLLDQLGRRMRTPGRRVAWALALAALAVAGVLDQTPRQLLHPEREREFAHDAGFVRDLEARLPEGAMVYQLPYVPFPEGGSDDHLRLSTHSRALRWSWPVMRGRPEDFWHKRLAAKAPAALVESAALAGFAGVCVDRKMCADRGRTDEAGLAALLGPPSLVSPNGRYAYFDLGGYSQTRRSEYGSEEWERRCERERRPVVGLFGRGFAQTAELMPKDGRWCGPKGELVLHNFADAFRTVRVRMSCRGGSATVATLTLEGAVERSVAVSDREGDFEQVVTLGPGRNLVRIRCDAAPLQGQSRRVFRVTAFEIEPADEGRPVAVK